MTYIGMKNNDASLKDISNSEYPVKGVSNHSDGGFVWWRYYASELGQEVIGGRSCGSDLSTAWLNMLEVSGGKVKTYQ